ncbi:MAG: TIGR02147 family protein [Proteobacteria bacterium]|nr:MAG: TIGR02147 family protein [Pseudomonadota bacterium]
MFQNFLPVVFGAKQDGFMQTAKETVQSIIMEEFERRVRVNPRYSLRAFSASLGMSSGALSEILRNVRPVSLKTAAKISKSLGFNAAETKHFYRLVESEKSRAFGTIKDPKVDFQDPSADAKQKKLDEDTFHLISDWSHFAILNLLDCEGFVWEANYISKRLGLSQTQAKLAMNLLTRLGLVKFKAGKAYGAEDYLLSPSGIPSAAVREYHKQILDKAKLSLDLQSLDKREMNGVGFAVDPKKLPQIKREISEFLDELVSRYSKGKRHEVYFLETALFQITEGERDENK